MSRLGEINRGSSKLLHASGRSVAWYWHELKSHNYVLRENDGYGTTGKEMKKGELSRDGRISGSCFNGQDVIPWSLLVGVHGGVPSI
ncbi:hypothetical protein DEO72_LG3g1503 [Vigna unguiculata]|uniref:Uncharacterized protein n=1 Tax=Vigna unguiculata TaxID=3917 RepID=A0A4D6LEE2_VIGUN|nr:hypothetical protein DEO72_LG3g1503 [Vigna unguiculata]